MSLTDKQARFIEEYLIDLNATQAAIRAGYSEDSARNIGSENLSKPDIQESIAAAMQERSERTEITQDRVLRELARVAFANIRELFEWDEGRACFVPSKNLTEDQSAAISEVWSETVRFYNEETDVAETKVKLKLKTYDKLSALEKLGKHLGLFVDRVVHSGTVNTGVLMVPESPENWHKAVRESQSNLTDSSANRVAALAKAPKGNGKKNGDGP